MRLYHLLIIPAVLTLAACGAQAVERQPRLKAPAVEIVGDPVSCIPLSQTQRTTVHDDFTIDFDMAGDGTYRNTLPHQCYSLGFEKAFAYQTSLTQLCNTDIIHVLYSDGHDGPACGLGPFVPVRIVKPQ